MSAGQPEFDKDGQMICGVCGYFWADHTIGGNCTQMPRLATYEDEDEVLHYTYDLGEPHT